MLCRVLKAGLPKPAGQKHLENASVIISSILTNIGLLGDIIFPELICKIIFILLGSGSQRVTPRPASASAWVLSRKAESLGLPALIKQGPLG